MTEERLQRRHYDAHLEEILQELRTNVALLTDLVKRHDSEIGEIRTVMHGRDGRNGYNTRLEALEGAEDRRTWHIRLIWGTIVTSIVGWWFGKS